MKLGQFFCGVSSLPKNVTPTNTRMGIYMDLHLPENTRRVPLFDRFHPVIISSNSFQVFVSICLAFFGVMYVSKCIIQRPNAKAAKFLPKQFGFLSDFTPSKFNSESPWKVVVGRLLSDSYWVSVAFQGQTVKLREGRGRWVSSLEPLLFLFVCG